MQSFNVNVACFSGTIGKLTKIKISEMDRAGLIIKGTTDTSAKVISTECLSAIKYGLKGVSPRHVVELVIPEHHRSSEIGMAVIAGLLVSCGKVPESALDGAAFIGSLGVASKILPVGGAVSAALACKREHLKRIYVPKPNVPMVKAVVEGLEIVGIETVGDLCAVMGGEDPGAFAQDEHVVELDRVNMDMSDVIGQPEAVFACEVAAAGGHHLMLSGPPGAGKTMLARRLGGLLPPMTGQDRIEAVTIAEMSRMYCDPAIAGRRPFRAPHHTISTTALSGSRTRPGEATLAHGGVLMMDELPEFSRGAMEALNHIMQHRKSRVFKVEWLARFIMVATMDPNACSTEEQNRTYRARVIGTHLGDKIDVRVTLNDVDLRKQQGERGESSDAIRARVARAIERQEARNEKCYLPSRYRNVHLIHSPDMTNRWCTMTPDASKRLSQLKKESDLDGRKLGRLKRVSRTVADLRDQDFIDAECIDTALPLVGEMA